MFANLDGTSVRPIQVVKFYSYYLLTTLVK